VKKNIIQEKSFCFALRIIKLYKYLKDNKNEYVLSKQLLRSGTSIGVNIEESIGGQSKNDFVSKISVAYKEARETLYWLKLLKASNYLNQKQSESLINDCEEIIRIITKIQKTMKS
jgi:four helix bundle protein